MIERRGYQIVRPNPVEEQFHAPHVLRCTARRLEHLASLRIPVAGMSVLEVGAGIGDMSGYYVDRGCPVTITDVRSGILEHLKLRYPHQRVERLDMENPQPVAGAPFDIVHCYGLLYHLQNPAEALAFLSSHTKRMLFIETCVSFGENEAINPVAECREQLSQAHSGTGCRPTRPWVFNRLRELFEHVYIPIEQPNHEDFPLDWSRPDQHSADLQRAIFIASRTPLEHERLSPALIEQHTRNH